jgi:hypothetical protein
LCWASNPGLVELRRLFEEALAGDRLTVRLLLHAGVDASLPKR